MYWLSRYSVYSDPMHPYVIRLSTNLVIDIQIWRTFSISRANTTTSSLCHSAIRLNIRTYQKISHTLWSTSWPIRSGDFQLRCNNLELVIQCPYICYRLRYPWEMPNKKELCMPGPAEKQFKKAELCIKFDIMYSAQCESCQWSSMTLLLWSVLQDSCDIRLCRCDPGVHQYYTSDQSKHTSLLSGTTNSCVLDFSPLETSWNW